MRHGWRRALARLAAPLAVLGLAACVAQPPAVAPPAATGLAPVGFDRLPGWQEGHPAAAVPPFLEGCAAMLGHPDRELGGQGEAARQGGSPRQWAPACEAARALPPGDDAAARAFFETWFQPFRVTDGGKPDGLFTGYYEPEVRGARSPGGIYRYPLLGRPTDMVQADLGDFLPSLKGKTLVGRVERGRLVPYWDRSAIEDGVLNRQRLGILWLADPIDRFFLQIQGSGRVRLPDGRIVRVTYAAQNGQPYVPIGRVLADRGEMQLDQVSLESLRAWLRAHPGEAQSVMDQNPSYVFFREAIGVRPDQGPPGSLGAPLTPGRSLAVDPSFIPLGAPVWLDSTDPLSGQPLQRLMLAQDTGGAIKGPVRGDVFWGWGPDAEARAGRMHAKGSEYLLLPRPLRSAAN